MDIFLEYTPPFFGVSISSSFNNNFIDIVRNWKHNRNLFSPYQGINVYFLCHQQYISLPRLKTLTCPVLFQVAAWKRYHQTQIDFTLSLVSRPAWSYLCQHRVVVFLLFLFSLGTTSVLKAWLIAIYIYWHFIWNKIPRHFLVAFHSLVASGMPWCALEIPLLSFIYSRVYGFNCWSL